MCRQCAAAVCRLETNGDEWGKGGGRGEGGRRWKTNGRNNDLTKVNGQTVFPEGYDIVLILLFYA